MPAPRHRAARPARLRTARAPRLIAQVAVGGCVVSVLALGAAQARATDGTPASPGTIPSRIVPADARLITGVVVDRDGDELDDVLVRAVAADGSTRASALTYASAFESGPQHGFFFLELEPGLYDVRVTKAGYVPAVLRDVEVGADRDIRLGLVEVKRLPAASRTVLTASRSRLPVGGTARLQVRVASTVAAPTGRVEVRDGRRVVARATLRAGARGRLSLQVPRLARGRHVLVARYAGDDAVAASTSRQVVVRVGRNR